LGYPHFWKLPQHLTGFLGAEELVHATGLVAATFARGDPATESTEEAKNRRKYHEFSSEFPSSMTFHVAVYDLL
jgi:hypothetical protein